MHVRRCVCSRDDDAVDVRRQMSTTEGWLFITLAAVDSRGIDQQPLRDANPVWLLFFVVFMVRAAAATPARCL
jgi:hypothetical protein